MIKAVITVDGTSVTHLQENKNANKIEAMLLIQELERRKHELLHEMDDDFDIEWDDEQ
jgi:hypothetical protein